MHRICDLSGGKLNSHYFLDQENVENIVLPLAKLETYFRKSPREFEAEFLVEFDAWIVSARDARHD